MKKKLTLIELNEFNKDLLKEISSKYNFVNIKKLFDNNIIITDTEDKKEHYNLDPWVQWVSIHTGKPSSEHKILELGKVSELKHSQIWDLLVKNKIKCGVFGAMNSKLKKNNYLKFYVPDPWNYSQKANPKSLNWLISLSKYYSTNYSNINFINLSYNFFKSLFFLIYKINIFFKLKFILNIVLILKNFKLKSVGLFLINDYISVLTFDHFKRKYNTEFEIIFLNSIAHYQHNYWGKLSEKENKFFFNIIDQIIKILIKKENKFLIANGFSQYKNLKDDYIIYRQKDPKKFLKKLNISFKSINQNMTNETLINFVNIIKLNDAFNKLGKIYVDGKKFLNIEKNEKKLNIFIKINFHKLIKNDKIKVKDNTIYLNKYLYPIRRTGSHSDEGIIITNLDSKINRIYNHDIHRLICEYFVIN